MNPLRLNSRFRLSAICAGLSVALVAVVACALITYEVFRYAEARERIRHAA
jgi:hypothetical protein